MPWLVLAFLVWLVGYPLLVVAAEAFGIGGASGDGPTTEAFRSFFTRADEWRAMWRTLWISVLSTILAAAVGVPLGFLFERNEIPGRRLLGALVALPVALPPLVGVIAFLFLYGESGLAARGLQTLGLDVSWRLTGAWAILLVHAYSMYVYFYLFARAGLSGQDGAAIEAWQVQLGDVDADGVFNPGPSFCLTPAHNGFSDGRPDANDIINWAWARMDHGSQYLSDHFLNQVRYWGIRPSFGLLEEPETNGVVERWNRTLKEQAIYGRVFRSLADVHAAVDEFVERYNQDWRLEKLAYRTPLEAREEYELRQAA